MIRLTIDHQTIEAEAGSSVYQAASSAGIEIPTMCYLAETGHITSCMVCLVKNAKNGQFFASCSTPVMEGQVILTNDPETVESRRMALELLLSEHVGDCEAPCQLVCPAHMNIPLMNRLIAHGDLRKALEVVKRDIPLPSVLGRICPAPCEAACRRKQVDEAVSICLLKRSAGDSCLPSENPLRPEQRDSSGKRVAIIGAGPAGLSAAYYLQLAGHQAVIFEKSAVAGGALVQLDEEILPANILRKEIEEIMATGVLVRCNETIDTEYFAQLHTEYDALIIATGTLAEKGADFGLERSATGFFAEKHSYQASVGKVFVIGNALRTSKMAVRSVGQGHEVAMVVDQLLRTSEIKGAAERFNSKFGRLVQEELVHYLKEAEPRARVKAGKEGFNPDSAMLEAKRCMHCDCRKPESCKLRKFSGQFQADQKRFKREERNQVEKLIHREGIVYESAKCIKCGICVRLTSLHSEAYGLTFIGRGFNVKVGIPFNESMEQGLRKTALLVAKSCPTGALAIFGDEEQEIL